MKRNYTKLTTLFALAALSMSALPAAHADLILTLTPDTLSGSTGEVLHFIGSLQNTDASAPVFLTGDNFSLTDPGLALDDSPFIMNAPTSLAAAGDPLGGDKFSGDLFDVTIAKDALPGNYHYSFSVLGGSNGIATDTLATTSFNVAVTPEPSAYQAGIILGVCGLGYLVRRRK